MSDLLRVLIVDDSAITRGLFEKAFKMNNFEIAGMVSNGRKAVDFCRINKVDAVISDYDMPEMNGLEAAKIIEKEYGLPVVIYSDDVSLKANIISEGIGFEKKPSLSTFDEIVLKDFTQRVYDSI